MGLYVLKYPYRKVLMPLSRALGWVHPDVLSYLAVAAAAAAAACYLHAATWPALLLWAVGLTLLRMTLNTLDGMIAIARGALWLKGEIVNALPDRYSDIFLVGGIALSPLCSAGWGLAAMASMLLVSYAGMLGKALGAAWQHHGPLGKVERLVLVMAFSLAQYVRLRSGAPAWAVLGFSLTPLECCMGLFVVLGQVTVVKRTRGMLRQIARLEWPRRYAGREAGRRVLVVYDSATGNTRKAAAAIADCLKADLARADAAPDPSAYDLVVIGSPTIRGEPARAVLRFLADRAPLKRCAAFVTYGAPVWGPIAARKAMRCIARAAGARPIATFTCKGYHAKFKTYRGHPNDDDLLSAFLFGIKLAKTGSCHHERFAGFQSGAVADG